MVLFSVFIYAVFGFMGSVMFIFLVGDRQNGGTFWSLFAFNFALGLVRNYMLSCYCVCVYCEFLQFQAWFLMDFIKLGLRFRAEWKHAHPPPRPADENEQDKIKQIDQQKKKEQQDKWLSFGFCLLCFPLWIIYQLCCKKKKNTDDPYDDGQDEYGVNYHEYVRWKHKEDIGQRAMPKSYQLAIPDIGGKLNEAVDGAAKRVTNTYDANVKGIRKAQNDVKQQSKKFSNKLKMGMAKGLSKVRSKEDDDDEEKEVEMDEEEVDLVVDA